MTFVVHAPLAGSVIDLADVPDPVFAEAIVGPGFGLVLPDESESVDALAPVDGALSSLHPHAFIVKPTDGPPVLVHLGIDTVDLKGRGFTVFAEVGGEVATGDTLVAWDLEPARTAGLSTVVPVVALAPNARIELLVETGADVEAGDPIARVL